MSQPHFQPLLAKSRPKDKRYDPPTIEEHCLHVHKAADAVWCAIEMDLANALNTSADELRTRLRPLLLIAALLHDIGKANSAFQAMVHRTGDSKRQPVRHEVLAAILLTNDRFWGRWFKEAIPDESDRWSVIWAVGGHHLELRRKRFGETHDPMFVTDDVSKDLAIYVSEQQVVSLLSRVRQIVCERGHKLDEAPVCESLSFDPLDEGDDGLELLVRRFARESDSVWRRLQHDASIKRNLALLKALLIAADVAGSALPATSEDIATWITSKIAVRLQPEQADAIAQANLNGRTPHRFQDRVAESDHRVTIVTAGCGNGKTTAAYMWARDNKWVRGRKLIFAYPTTGTASAGFEDYLFTQPGLERDLVHSRAKADLQVMFHNADHASPIETTLRLEALNAWRRQAITCTVDTVLGLIQNQRRPLFGFPAITCAAFVFDEVHSYDRRLFGALLRFLQAFRGVPVLIMSASIPPNRLEAIRAVAGTRMNQHPIEGDPDIERVKRYKMHTRSLDDCWDEVERLLRKRKKALWVCNTVAHAIDVFREAQQRFSDISGLEALLYHSRMRYGGRPDFPGRVERQSRVIDEFRYFDDEKTRRQHERPSFVVTTQVCEMSLDISADLLVTALCPLPSLVQRLGRLNRYARRNDPRPALIYPFQGRPYHKDDYPAQMAAAQEMIEELDGQACNQAVLAGYINAMSTNEVWTEYSAWLDGGWQSEPLPARDGDNTITVVRREDLDRLVNGLGKPLTKLRRHELIPITIPMLIPTAQIQKRLGLDFGHTAGGYPVAPIGSIRYDDEQEGASWDD